MKQYLKTGIIIYLICISSLLKGQQIGDLRYLDNNKALAEDTTDCKIIRSIKEIGLTKNHVYSSLSIGGELREQFRYFGNMNFGDVRPGTMDHDIYLYHRFLLHADLRLNKNFRLFGQLNSNHITGKDNITPEIDRDDLGLMQAFIDFQFNMPKTIQLRFGRQELSFGSERILGTRSGPNIRQSFDGARITLVLKKVKGDFFVVQPVSYKIKVFDNIRDKSSLVYSSYWTVPVMKRSVLDLYYFGAQLKKLSFANDTATENRHSIGMRFSNNISSLYYDAEFVYQFGNFGINQIRAWQISSHIGYRWTELSFKPRVQLREVVISGDKIANDGFINTFRAISARPPINDMVQCGPANVILISPEAQISISNKVTLSLIYYQAYRYSKNDGLYTPDVKVMTRKADETGVNNGKLITKGAVLQTAYIMNKHFSITLALGYFKPGIYINNIGKGENLEALSLNASYKF